MHVSEFSPRNVYNDIMHHALCTFCDVLGTTALPRRCVHTLETGWKVSVCNCKTDRCNGNSSLCVTICSVTCYECTYHSDHGNDECMNPKNGDVSTCLVPDGRRQERLRVDV